MAGAQILTLGDVNKEEGSPHPYDSGINIDFFMYQFESRVARWTIQLIKHVLKN